jgi:hypothetical protein
MQLNEDLKAKLTILEKLNELDRELISMGDDPACSQVKDAALIVKMCSELQKWVAKSLGLTTNE